MDSVSYSWAREADLEHLIRAFDGLPTVMYGYILGPCWRKVAKEALDIAKAAPVLTRHKFPAIYKGKPRTRLGDSGQVRRRSWHYNGKEVKGSAADVKFRMPHAHLVEFGTTRMAAQPFLEPAMREAARKVPGVISTLGRKKFRQAIKAIESGTAPMTLARAVAEDV